MENLLFCPPLKAITMQVQEVQKTPLKLYLEADGAGTRRIASQVAPRG